MFTRKLKLSVAAAVLVSSIGAYVYAADEAADMPSKYPAEPVHEVEFYGSPGSSISGGVSVPAGASYLFTSGTVPPLLNKEGKTVYERYGDTKTQATGILTNIEKQLADKGLSLKDVIYLRVYVAPDAAKENKFDFAGWNEAYALFFNNADNPVKTARSTVGVPALVSSDWLIEIEAVAVYPKAHNQN
ncbi:Enamine deaminase RidA, house cleaning of reactive enamine intermediates, YjgF/YER057c/UK114 family [Paenibacillus sp. UNCCL117]|uniref:RidA family protein n=1 Tax=unclassified Paenibacillus TaxID=185978 RepID=UPI000881958B|nr:MULTISPECIES: RidA family protein [unclassified Paenibacillus]SDE66002.1 Enamine deaminase RidA, house cleaning of reactive enamine intermediates, YjgF/YER057c/UK114 family [Paenibacillus sp. cl123]SFW70343.1 Enamine deaminase RidA, house cleaning of reactive enamine intermediates, YjgF/YER057c/UK114 family [Paenibacillus sp. UNCCL117]